MSQDNNRFNQTLYKESLYKQIIGIIGDPKKYIKSKKALRENISNKLKELSLITEFTNLFDSDFNFNIDEFNQEKKLFSNLFVNLMKENIKRKDSSNLNNQLLLVIDFLQKYAYENGFIDQKINNYEILNEIKENKIFYILLSSSVSSIVYIPRYDQMNHKTNNVESNEIDRFIFSRKVITSLIIYIMSIIVNNKTQASSFLIKTYQNIDNIIYDSLSNNLGQCYVKSSLQLIWSFSDIFNIPSRTIKYKDKSGNIKSMCLLKLPSKIVAYAIPATHLPEITEPKVDYSTFENEINLSKKIKNGVSVVDMSSETKDALIISQKAKFKINENSVNLFKKLDSLPYEIVENIELYPYSSLSVLTNLDAKIKKLTDKLGQELINSISDSYKNNIKSKEYINRLDEKIINDLGITKEILDDSKELYQIRKEFKERLKLRTLHNTILKFAEIFHGFPIYFINAFDYRLRMYPWNYMFNRTSGVYKYLLNGESSLLSLDGLKTMIKAYYKNDSKYQLFSKLNNKDSIIELFNNIEKNEEYNEKLSSKYSFYHDILKREIKSLKDKKYRTGFMIEIDQKSSASVILSIVLGDEILAKETNLLSKEEKKDVNNYILEKSKIWFKNKITDESYKIIINDRKFHKYLFMCFIYNETQWGRIKRIKEYIKNENDVINIAKNYPNFINDVFPSVYTKKELFNKIVEYYIKNSNEGIEIETLDNSIVKWYIFKKNSNKNIKIKINHPITKENISYHFTTYNNKKIHISKILTGIMPHLIHSIDGAIMRVIIKKVYNKKKYIINHLHDSIQFHPNHYSEVMESINEVYTSDIFANLLERRFFSRLRNNLLPEYRSQFDNLIEVLHNNDFREIRVLKEDLNSEGMFPFE